MNYKQIKQFFPQFKFQNEVPNISFYILRDMTIAGLFIATDYDKDTLKVTLDYVTPAYRDFKIGNYIHHQLVKYFIARGYRKLLCETNSPAHIKYLTRMGYEKTVVNSKTVYMKSLG